MKTLLTACLLAVSAAGCASAAPSPPVAASPAFASERISVEVRGSGPDVILIPGLASSARVWDATADRLDDDYRVHVVQVRGFAGTPAGANAEGPVFRPLVDELDRYVRSQGLSRPAVIGHSMGGEAGLLLAARHPQSVGKVLVVDALPFFGLMMNPQATAETIAPQAAAARDGLLAMDDAGFRATQAAGIARLVKNPEARTRHGAFAAASDRAVVARVMHEIITDDLRPELAANAVPVIVLYAWDPVYGVPVERFERMWTNAYAGVPQVKLVRVEGSFHFIMDDQPERFAQEVQAFLRSAP